VIAITAYTEPIPVEAAVNDPHVVHENEEREERSNFAELLAGLLQKTQNDQDNLFIEKSQDEGRLGFFANAIEDGAGFEGFSDIDLSDAVIEKEYQNILSAEHLFNSSLVMEDLPNDDLSGLSMDIDAKTVNRLADLAARMEKTSTAENQQNDPTSQLLASLNEVNAKKSAEEALAAAEGKKRRVAGDQPSSDAVSKNDKIDNISANNKASEENAALLNKREESLRQNPGRLEELRNRSRRERAAFEIRDLRTVTNSGIPNNSEMRAYTLVETTASRMSGQASVQEITLELRLPDHGQSSQAQTSWEAKASAAMENMLARELHQSFNGDIVRHASMVLKNGGEGLIKLNLRPDSLGNVKIHLELTDNKITGRILVESEEALNAFRKEISSLEQAFKDSGFAEANLNLSLTGGEAGAENQELEDGFFASNKAATNYEASFEQETAPIIDVFFGRSTGTVNMLA